MPDTLPARFDPDWYRATYPDVALTGMDPSDHYLRFGRLLGRRPYAGAPVTTVMPPLGGTAGPVPSPTRQSHTPSGHTPSRPSRPGPIIDRPADFTAAAAPRVAEPDCVELDGSVAPAALARAPFAAPGAAVALVTYARLFGLTVSANLPDVREASLTGTTPFQSGPLRIESLWMATAGTLRLRLAGGEESAGVVLRAYQATPKTPERLISAGEGLTLPAEGPVFWDLALVHPLMPVLVQATDSAGVVQGTALLAFPSLVPGGLHAAEAKALQSTASPVDSLWAHAELLLRERLGHPDWNAPSLARITVDLHGATGAEPLFAEPLLDWLEALFGLSVTPADAEGLTLGETALHASLTERAAARPAPGSGPGSGPTLGLTLDLPLEGVPTLTALVSRRLDDGISGARMAPYLVAEEATLRPRWMVTPATDAPLDPAQPSLVAPDRADAPPASPVPVPVAVLYRPQNPPHHTRLLLPVAPDAAGAETVKPLDSVLIVFTAWDPARTEDLLRRLLELSRPRIAVRLAGTDTDRLRESLEAVLGRGGWDEVASSVELRSLARASDARLVLTIDDRVVIYDPLTLKRLAALADSRPDVASASCLLLGERAVKKHGVLQPATGGLFPSRVSFAAAPLLGFNEPDTFQPLPYADYAVAANTLMLTLWQRELLAALPLADGPLPATAADIAPALDALAAGYRHLCSSKIRAGYLGDYTRRDEIDPVGTQYLRPALWEDIFRRVTVLRELF